MPLLQARPWIRALLLRWRLLSLLAFGGPLLAIALVQYRWLDELRGRSQMIESQRSREVANRVIAVLEETITRARLEFLPSVVHADLLYLRLQPLARHFDRGLTSFPYIEHFFVWAAPSPPEGTLFYFSGEKRFRKAPELTARYPSESWITGPGSLRWAEFHRPGKPAYQIVVHRIMEPEGSRQNGVVGFAVNLDSFARDFLPSFHAQNMLPLLRGVWGEKAVPLAFFDEKGRRLFSTAGSPSAPLPGSTVDFPLSFGVPSEKPLKGQPLTPRWRLSVGEAPGGVEEILRQGALSNLAVVGVGILVLALGAALIARSSNRAAQLSDLKSRFISGVSHELKTPLALIRLYSEMLELGRVPDETERKVFYRKLRQQAEALGDMLEQILDFSRLEAEQKPLRKETCSLQGILEEAIDMLTASGAVPRAVSLSTTGDLPEVDCDRRGLVRAIYNLLDNAAKYSDPDQPIEVRAAARNGLAAVEILDRGAGILPEELPHVFERFYRGRLASSLGVKGAGLGLSIAEAVVKAHRGRIEVESAPGRGSRFAILLPLPRGKGLP